MKVRLGILGCLLAGCVAQPERAIPNGATARTRLAAKSRDAVLRIGIEHLPPDDRFPQGEVRVAATNPAAATPRGQDGTRSRGAQDPERDVDVVRTHVLTSLDLSTVVDPVERETLHFLVDLVKADQLRVRRTGGNPLLDFYLPDQERGSLLVGEQLLLADQEEWLQQHGPGLLQRPLRQLLRRLPIVQQFELGVREFRSDNLPLPTPWQSPEPGRTARISVRLHVDDLEDPLEVMVSQYGLRIGTSQNVGKFGWALSLSEALQLELRARTEYDTGDHAVRVDLSYRPSSSTSYHLSVGDDMDFLNRSPLYSLLESPIDGAPGIVLYAVHRF